MIEQLQVATDTAENRYPWIFDAAREAFPGARRVLSFGCSTGEEMLSLRARFPEAEIVGVDIDARVLAAAAEKAAADGNMRALADTEALETESFDLVTCLSVLCAFPPRAARPVLPFALFEAAVTEVARLLRPGGYAVIYNAQFLLDDVPAVRRLLQPCWHLCRHPSTFVQGFRVLTPGGEPSLWRMPIFSRRLPAPTGPGRVYAAVDAAAQDARSVLFYYCWTGNCFLHSQLHHEGRRVDGYEPAAGPREAAPLHEA